MPFLLGHQLSSTALKRKHTPPFAVSFNAYRVDCLPRERRDRTLPKAPSAIIRFHHAHFPSPRKHSPNLVRSISSNSPLAKSTGHEELRNVPHTRVTRNLRSSLDQRKSRPLVIYTQQERMPSLLAEVKRQLFVYKLAIRLNLNAIKRAEILRIQLKQTGKHRLVFRCGGNHFNLSQGCSRAMSHIGNSSCPGPTNGFSPFLQKHSQLIRRTQPNRGCGLTPFMPHQHAHVRRFSLVDGAECGFVGEVVS